MIGSSQPTVLGMLGRLTGLSSFFFVTYERGHFHFRNGTTYHPPINRFVFSFQPNDQPCDGLEGVLERYHAIARVARLSGPTNFAPMIYHAMEIVRASQNVYHILLILCDGRNNRPNNIITSYLENPVFLHYFYDGIGAVVCESETAEAIVAACSVPLSIIIGEIDNVISRQADLVVVVVVVVISTLCEPHSHTTITTFSGCWGWSMGYLGRI